MAISKSITGAASRLAWPLLRAAGEQTHWRERWDAATPAAPIDIWIHTASLGEITPLREAIAGSPSRIGVTVTSGRSFQAVADLLGESADVRPLPIPRGPGFETLISEWQPGRLVLLEAEAWPALLGSVPDPVASLAVLNGRIRLPNQPQWRATARRMPADALQGVWVAAQAEAERYMAVGCPPEKVHTDFHLKLLTARRPCDEQFSTWRRPGCWHAVAGSIHPDDADMLAEAWVQAAVLRPGGRLLVVPRHPQRVARVEAPFRAAGLSVGRWPDAGPETDVTIVAQFGVLAGLYELADLALVGGAWASKGGHNVVEAVVQNKPVLIGPNHKNQRALLPQLNGAVTVAADPEAVAAWLVAPDGGGDTLLPTRMERARDVVNQVLTL